MQNFCSPDHISRHISVGHFHTWDGLKTGRCSLCTDIWQHNWSWLMLENLPPGHGTPSIHIKYYFMWRKTPRKKKLLYFLTEDMVVKGLELVKPWETQDYVFSSFRKLCVPFTSQPEFPESLCKWKTPSVSSVKAYNTLTAHLNANILHNSSNASETKATYLNWQRIP